MAIKTFTAGSILTASDTNTFLGNSGLVYVGSGSFAGAASFEMTGISSTYTYYRAVFSAITNTTANYQAVLYNGATARNSLYYAGVGYAGFDNTTGGANSSNNTAFFYAGQGSSAYRSQTVMDFRFKTGEMFTFTLQGFESNTFRSITSGGFRNATDAFDRIRITPSASATATGEWRLYGYREP
jgi:hypothetical protein